jgi:hypothetical protein
MMSPRIIIPAGVVACAIDRVLEQAVRKIIDMHKVHMNENRRKRKNGPGSRRRFVMKYITRLTETEVMILEGKSQIMDATASDAGW